MSQILQCTLTTEGSITATPSQRRACLRAGFHAVGHTWDYRFKMMRFLSSAYGRYGLTPRGGEKGRGRFKGSYTEAKLLRRTNGQGVRAIGDAKPFVWSGNSRARAQSNARIVATAASSTRGHCENIIDVPTLNFKAEGSPINMRAEFERVTEDERRTCEGEGLHKYELELEKLPPKTTRIA